MVAGCRCVVCCTGFSYSSEIKNNRQIQEYASLCLSIKATMMIYKLSSPIGSKIQLHNLNLQKKMMIDRACDESDYQALQLATLSVLP